MPNYTEYLNLEKPLQGEQYNVDVFNDNADKIDEFARTTPSLALSANVLTNGANINGVNFKGNKDIITGLGLYSNTTTYSENNIVYIFNTDNQFKVFRSLTNENVGNNPLLDDETYWEEISIGGSGSVGRLIGEIVTSSLPLTDAGLHLLDGTRLFLDGVYNDFVQYIANLYTENPNANYFTTEEAWQNCVAITGSCAKFVYDSSIGAVRLPKISDIIQGTTNLTELGNIIEAGLPSITHTHSGTTANGGGHNHTGTTNTESAHTHAKGTLNATGTFTRVVINEDKSFGHSGVFSESVNYTVAQSDDWGFQGDGDCKSCAIKFNLNDNLSGRTSAGSAHSHTFTTSTANAHSHTYVTGNNTSVDPIYGNSNTVQPQTARMLVYIVVANITKTNLQADLDNLATDLNNKCDKDFSNVTWTDDMKQIVYDVIGDGISHEAATADVIGMVKPDGVTTTVDEDGVLSATLNPENYYNKQQIDSMLSTIYDYKGNVATYNDLPQNASVGDVYFVINNENSYAWNGEEWNVLPPNVNLSGYYTKTEVDTMMTQKNTQINNLSVYIVDLQNRVSELERIISGGNA